MKPTIPPPYIVHVQKQPGEHGILPGSALVSRPYAPSDSHVVVYFEGNTNGACNLRSFVSRAFCAAGRLGTIYPTVAMMRVPTSSILRVGRFEGTDFDGLHYVEEIDPASYDPAFASLASAVKTRFPQAEFLGRTEAHSRLGRLWPKGSSDPRLRFSRWTVFDHSIVSKVNPLGLRGQGESRDEAATDALEWANHTEQAHHRSETQAS